MKVLWVYSNQKRQMLRLENFQYLFQSQYFQSCFFTLKMPFLKIYILQSHGERGEGEVVMEHEGTLGLY